jgi:Family of unknown function (DUF5677)
MRNQDLEFAIGKFVQRTAFLQEAVQFLESQLPLPQKSLDADRGFVFRFKDPDLNHFCLLHLLRIVSCLHSLNVLVKSGFPQEIAVLVRTVYEFLLKVEYVSSGYYDLDQRDKISKYIRDYFDDNSRKEKRLDKTKAPRQEEINRGVGKLRDENLHLARQEGDNRKSADMQHYILSVFSNYVHGRYPEIMDMFGGTPIHAHYDGMLNTPKDEENIAIVFALVDSVDLCVRNVFIRLGHANSEHTPNFLRKWIFDFSEDAERADQARR